MINNSSIPKSQSQQEMLDRFNDAIANITFNLNNDKQDTEITSVPSTNCKYFTINELNSQKIDPNKNFSMLHLNISSIEYHIEVFRKGGVLIYTREGIAYKPREDLQMHKSKELESYFIEKINKKGKK